MEKSAASYQVLVVDDSAVYRKLVEHALESQPYSLLFAKTGVEALALSCCSKKWLTPIPSPVFRTGGPSKSGPDASCEALRAMDFRCGWFTPISIASKKSTIPTAIGDEFLLVITHVAAEQIQLTVERLREQFASTEFTFAGGSGQLTASFGISGFCGTEAPEFSALVREADQALYCAKHAGGNQVKVATSPTGGE